jgi:hypothetical protein
VAVHFRTHVAHLTEITCPGENACDYAQVVSRSAVLALEVMHGDIASLRTQYRPDLANNLSAGLLRVAGKQQSFSAKRFGQRCFGPQQQNIYGGIQKIRYRGNR